MIREINKELILNFVSDNCNEQERLFVLEWLRNSKNEAEIKLYLNEIWSSINERDISEEFDKERVLNKIHHLINISEPKSKSIPLNTTRKNLLQIFYKVAAVILLPLIVFNMFYFLSKPSDDTEAWQQISVVPGVKTKITLSDGTNVWVNSKSTLKYPVRFYDNKRVVEMSGEAYFEVAKDKKRPFIVKSGEVEVKALGTKFNVEAYADDNSISATLIEGKIEVKNKVYKQILDLNQKIIFQGDKITIEGADPKVETAWIHNKLILRETSIEKVAYELSRWFNVDIILMDKELNNLTFTATIKNESLKQVLTLLKIAAPIDYSIEEPKKENDNTYSKTIVKIWKRK